MQVNTNPIEPPKPSPKKEVKVIKKKESPKKIKEESSKELQPLPEVMKPKMQPPKKPDSVISATVETRAKS